MSIIYKLLSYCFPVSTKTYTKLSKKDEDSEVKNAENWAQNWSKTYSVDYIKEHIRYANLAAIDAYATEIIGSLSAITITSSNISIIKPCLIEMAEGSVLLREALLRKISKLTVEKLARESLRKEIHDTLLSTFQKD